MEIRKGDHGNERLSLGRQVCIDRGCIEWREGVEDRFCGILHPEKGALAGVHNRITNMLWKGLAAISTVIVALFVFYTWDQNSIKANQHDVNIVHDDAVKKQDLVIEQIGHSLYEMNGKLSTLVPIRGASPRSSYQAPVNKTATQPMPHEQLDSTTRISK